LPSVCASRPWKQVDQLAQHRLVELRAAIVLGQDVLEHGGIGALDESIALSIRLPMSPTPLAGGQHRGKDLRALGIGLQMVPARFGRHPEHMPGEVFLRVFGIGKFSSANFVRCLECPEMYLRKIRPSANACIPKVQDFRAACPLP
jgi:hypothetical protein